LDELLDFLLYMSVKFKFGVFLSRYASVVSAVVVCPSVWCGCSVPVAEWLDLPAVSIRQLAHAAGESIFCREGGDVAVPKWLWGGLVHIAVTSWGSIALHWL